MKGKVESFSKEMEGMQKNQLEILEMKNRVTNNEKSSYYQQRKESVKLKLDQQKLRNQKNREKKDFFKMKGGSGTYRTVIKC